MKNLIFCDVETTGLDEKKDYILEIALVAVSLPRFEEVAAASWLVVPPLWSTVKRNMHEKVRQMHERTGLTAELDAEASDDRGIYCAPQTIEGEAVAFVREHAPHTMTWHTPLAGCNPDFDRRFLRQRMPKLHAAVHYRNFDCRAITQLQDWILGTAHQESPHRALADCRLAVQQIRAFLGL